MINPYLYFVARPRRPLRNGALAGPTHAFALITVLAILALLLVLVLSISSVLHVEIRASGTGKDLLVARNNAILGLQTAMGQLQEYAGKDQATTFPATTFYPTKDLNLPTASSPRQGKGDLFDNPTYGYRAKAQTSSARSYLSKVETYLTPAERTAWDDSLKAFWNADRNPRWVGIMDASLRVDRATNPNADPVPLPAQPYETLGDATTFGEPKRDQLPVWLVSGNERFTINQQSDTTYPPGYLTPDSVLPDPSADDSIVYLVGEGSATDETDSSDGIDGRVKAKKQEVLADDPGGSDLVSGNYAYWVGDESTKANFGVRDPYFDAAVGSVEYRNRLQSPQRVGWENVAGFDQATFDINDPKLEYVSTSKEIGLLEDTNTLAIKDAAQESFHSLTAFSKSLLTDTALGGLKKDLTQFLEGNGGPSETTTIPAQSRYSPTDARFRAWGGSNSGFPASLTNLPTWGQLKAWYANEASGGGAITPNKDTAPVLAYLNLHAGWSYSGGKVRWHWVPSIVLWNPYDVPLSTATYELEIGISPRIVDAFVVKERPTLAELQAANAEANWAGNPADRSTWTYLPAKQAATPTPINAANPNTVNFTDADQLWPKDTNLADGTTDAFGRLWYRLSSSDPSVSSGYQPSGTSTSRSALGSKSFGSVISPFDNTSKPRDNLPVDQPLRFQISSGFSPGQVKIFTVGTTQIWNKSAAIPLVNDFDPDQPSSVYLDLFDVANGPASSNGELKFSFDHTAEGVYAPTVHLKVGGETIAKIEDSWGGIRFNNVMTGVSGFDYREWVRFGTGSKGGQSEDGADNVSNRSEAAPKFVSDWRPLYDTGSDFETHIIPQNTLTTASSIFPYGETWIQPLTANGGNSVNQVNERIPVFSRFNIAAKSLDEHPLVDAKRETDGENNRDASGQREGLAKIYSSRSTDTWDISSPSKWDNDQANGTEGYALITYKDVETIDGSSVTGLSELAIRNARRANSEVLSLGQLQQANLSEFFWQPSFPIGNSFAAPYTDREAIAGINSREIGGSNSTRSITTSGVTSIHPSGPIGYVPNDAGNRMLDLSYLLNENLWDSYFLSTISGPPDLTQPLPNSRLRFLPDAGLAAAELRKFETASAYLENFGALNVNSTSVEAWKALLTAFRDLTLGNNPAETVPIARTLDPIADSVQFTEATQNASDTGATSSGKDYRKIVSGFRYLTDPMIKSLAERIVDEVRLRGPFLSLADFINRRLVSPSGSRVPGSDWYLARTDGYVGFEGGGRKALGGPTADNADDNQSDFINPSYDPFIGVQGLSGALERAVQVSGINGGVNHPQLGPDGSSSSDQNDRIYGVRIKSAGSAEYVGGSSDYGGASPIGGSSNNQSAKHTQEPAMRSHLDTEHIASAPVGEAGQLFDGTPGFVTQGDLLAMIGPALTARGDTFLIRTYGDAVDKNGGILARAYLEAVVQRVVEPVKPAGTSGPEQFRYTDKFGRKFEVVKLRWLNPEEV